MAFNPDEYLNSKSGDNSNSAGFDPDAYLASLTPKQPKDSDISGAAQAGLEHFGNAASFGYMPQIQGIASQIAPDPNADLDAKLRAQGFKVEVNKPTYVQDRDAYIKHLQDQEKEHPLASAAGTVGGALASGIATSGLTPINAATRMGRIGQAMRAGAVVGAVSNPGDTEGKVADGIQLNDRLLNAGGGALVGGATQGTIEGLSAASKAATNIASTLTNKAEERAFKSSGAMLKDYRNAASKDRINTIGRYMIDNGLVKPGMSVSDIADAADKLQAQHGAAIGDILDRLDQSGAAAPSHSDLAGEIEKQAVPMKDMNTAKPTYNALQDMATDIRTMGKGADGSDVPGSFNGAQKVKTFISDQINKSGGWNTPNPSEKNLALRDAYSTVNGMIENSADKAASSFGDNDLLQSYMGNKSGYRNALEVAKIAKDRSLRQNANNFFSIGDKIGAGTGFAAGFASGHDMEDRLKKGVQGAALGYGANIAATHGAPLVSNLLDSAGKKLAGTPLQDIGEMMSPALKASERTPIAASLAEGVASSPKLDRSYALMNVADRNQQDRNPSNLKGEDKWAQSGLDNLGITDQDAAKKILNSKEGKRLLIEASDLPANSKRLQAIKLQLQGRGK